MPNLRKYARGRPQIEQRFRCWVENLGFLFVLAIFAVVAMLSFGQTVSVQESAFSQDKSLLTCRFLTSDCLLLFKTCFYKT